MSPVLSGNYHSIGGVADVYYQPQNQINPFGPNAKCQKAS